MVGEHVGERKNNEINIMEEEEGEEEEEEIVMCKKELELEEKEK